MKELAGDSPKADDLDFIKETQLLLTPKESEIYQHMCSGTKNNDIALACDISINTLKEHARNIYKKLGVRNKRELLEKVGSDISDDPKNIFEQFATTYKLNQLTERETEVCYYMFQGLSIEDLSSKLFISKNTVKTHIGRIYSKLSVSSRSEFLTFLEK